MADVPDKQTSHIWHTPGINHVGSYQVSGRPWISGSADHAVNTEVKYSFPLITKSVTVVNHCSDAIRVHFNSTAHDIANSSIMAKRHFVELDSDEDSFTFNVKCKEIYVSAQNNGSARTYTVYAELTHIPAARMYDLTGSGLTEGQDG